MIDPDMQKVVDKVQKLLNLAARGGTEAEATAAAAQAQKLLTMYNLDMATVERSSGEKSGKREEAKVAGGMYLYQRSLWRNVAELNFCLYFTTRNRAERKNGKRFWQHQHRVVGRTVNTAMTQSMAHYLDQTVERLCRERYNSAQFFSREAVAYREGMVDRVIEKLQARRQEMVDEETRKKEAAEKADRAAGRVPTSHALSIVVLEDAETDANMDFLNGEGWSAKKAQRRAERAAEMAEADRQHTEWAKAHPEEAAAQAKKDMEERRRYWNDGRRNRERYSKTGAERRAGSASYYQGYDAGEKIGIDPQARDKNTGARRLT